MTTKTKTPYLVLAFAFGAALAAAGCHAAGPLLGKNAGTMISGSSATATSPINSGPAIETVVSPEGFPMLVSPSRIHVLELGDKAVTGIVEGTGSVALNDTLVYFTDAEERYYVARSDQNAAVGNLVAVRTDSFGKFTTPGVFPGEIPVVANALLSRNRRLEGFGVAGAGPVRVTPGSTYVVEFLRDQVAHRKLTDSALNIGSYFGRADVRTALIGQGGRADELITGGKLATPSEGPSGDLVIGNGAVLAARYTAQAFGEDEASFQAWKNIFPGLYALSTIAGDFNLRDDEPDQPVKSVGAGLHGPIAVTAVPGEPAVYIAERDGWHIKKANQAGMIEVFAGRLNGLDPTVEDATVSADNTLRTDSEFKLGNIHEVRSDSLGNLAVTFRAGAAKLHMVGFICKVAGSYFGRAMVADTFYYLTAKDGKEGYVDGPGETARFRDPQGTAFDDDGNLYVCDRRHNRVRRIDNLTGNVETVLGDGWPFLTPPATGGSSWGTSGDALGGDTTKTVITVSDGGVTSTASANVTDLGRHLDQAAGTGSGLMASLNRPLQLAWRSLANGTQELFIYDSYNSAVRKAVAPAGGSFKNAAVTTLTGKTRTFSHTGAATFSVDIGDGGAILDGNLADARFNMSRYDPSTRKGAQVVNGGMALDTERNLLFVTDTNNQAIRMINLNDGKVSTVARHGPSLIDGDSSRVLLSANLGGITLLGDGSVAFADNANHVVRRLHFQFGL